MRSSLWRDLLPTHSDILSTEAQTGISYLKQKISIIQIQNSLRKIKTTLNHTSMLIRLFLFFLHNFSPPVTVTVQGRLLLLEGSARTCA